MRHRPWLPALLPGVALAVCVAASAQAQTPAPSTGIHAPASEPVHRDQPVFYQSDSASYDRDKGVATLSGHVEIWQGNRVLRADQVTYDRNTGVAAAKGHVVLLDPSGQVVFADYAELSQGMKDGILSNFRAQLLQNGRLAANGARRVNAEVNELSRVIYSACNACKNDPNGPLLWDIRANSAIQDLSDQRIEYYDAVVDLFGWPVMYFPYLTAPDPSAKRSSGFLMPTPGDAKYLGAFMEMPYFWAIDGSSDATITPILSSGQGGALDLQLRHAFNDGTVNINTSIAQDQGGLESDLFATGQFAINDEWRWGFNIQRATTANYMRDYQIPGFTDVLTSTAYLESFGQGSYSRLDASAYQGLVTSIVDTELPFVLPRYEYSFVGEPDALGGRTSVEAGAFNVLRPIGTNTQRANLSLDWERPATGAMGDMWNLVLHLDSAAYNATNLNQLPSWGAVGSATSAQYMPTVAVDGRWPLLRVSDSGSQVIEPIVQLIGAPRGSSYGIVRSANGTPLYLNTLIPNEDSFDFQFTDATLFALNRYPGVDRLEGGPRANIGLHYSWYFGNGQNVDALIGQGYRTSPDPAFPVNSGLSQTVTDIVSHFDYTPNQYLDFTTRERFDHYNYDLRFFDGLVDAGPSWLRFSGGYIYETYNPYTYYDTVPSGILVANKIVADTFVPGGGYLSTGPVSEATVGLNVKYGHWSFGGSVIRDMHLGTLSDTGATLTYDDECFTLSANYFRRYTSIDGDNGATTLYFQITLKTIGSFNVNGM
jgi:LPS-assembly protein